MFNLALDPFLKLFDDVIRNKQARIIRACADDLGASLMHLKYLVYLAPIFEKADPLVQEATCTTSTEHVLEY